MKGRIIGREGRNIRALEQATGVDLIIDDTPESVLISGFDPVRREVARLALTKLIQDGRIHPGRIEEVVAKARAEVDLVIRQAGEAAAYETGVPGLPPEIIKLLGRLQVPHQLRPERAQARRSRPRAWPRSSRARSAPTSRSPRSAACCTTSARPSTTRSKGPHAAIGGQIAQRHNMPPKVINAIAAHHQEVEYACIEAPIVQIADAISASRPGRPRRVDRRPTSSGSRTCRRSPTASRASRSRSPSRPGREVRILVRPEEIDDLASMRLARDIVRKIEESLTYPGQIKVTVIRETRAVEYAK